MRWIGISGSWRYQIPELVQDVRREVDRILDEGDGIVTGGALGVDYWATEQVIKRKSWSQIHIVLPTSIEIFLTHYQKRAKEGVITQDQADELSIQLELVKHNNREVIFELNYKRVNKNSYYLRNSEIIEKSEKLVAFQVNKSKGVQDVIDKARSKNIDVRIFNYTH